MEEEVSLAAQLASSVATRLIGVDTTWLSICGLPCFGMGMEIEELWEEVGGRESGEHSSSIHRSR